MGIAEIAQSLKAQRLEKVGNRLFQYVRDSRAPKEILPMEPGQPWRASALPYLCPREEVLASKYEIIRMVKFPEMLQITMDIGHLFHDLYRNLYYGPMGEWVGAWVCDRCGWDSDAAGLSEPPVFEDRLVSPGRLAKMPGVCPGCGAMGHADPRNNEQVIRFKEWLIVDKQLGLSGHPDGWSVRPGLTRTLVDIKSHTKTGFASRNTPVHGHARQVLSYGHLTGDKVLQIWYANKSPWGDSPNFVRTVDVKWDRDVFDRVVRAPLEALQNGLAGGAFPDRICVTEDCPRARDCQLSDVCFFY